MRDFRHQASLDDRDREDLARAGVPALSAVGQWAHTNVWIVANGLAREVIDERT